MASLLRQPHPELARRRRLAGALQPQHQDDARPLGGRLQSAFGVAEQRDHLIAHDFHDLLRRGEAAQHLFFHRAVTHAVDERLDDLEVDVRLEQGEPDLAKGRLDGLGRQPGFTPQRLEYVLKSITEGLEHGPANSLYGKRLS